MTVTSTKRRPPPRCEIHATHFVLRHDAGLAALVALLSELEFSHERPVHVVLRRYAPVGAAEAPDEGEALERVCDLPRRAAV